MALSTILDRGASAETSSAMASPSSLLACGGRERRARTSERMVGRR
jgi:hypothetical protein